MVIVSFLTAVLAGMGVGSGGLLVVYLTAFVAMPQLSAQLLNLIFFAASSVAAIAVNLIKKRLKPGVILAIAIPGVLGAIGGAAFAHSVESELLGKGFGALLVVCGVISLLKGRGGGKIKRREDRREKYS